MPSATSGFARQAQHAAEQIVSRPPYHNRPDHSPLSRIFGDIGQWLYDAFGPVWHWLTAHVFRPTGHLFSATFGSWWPIVLSAVLLAVVAFVAYRLARRKAHVGVARAAKSRFASDEDPDELDREASLAESRGDHELAVRLRFRAGLARLERGGLVSGRRTHTNGQLSRMLGSPTFDRLAERVDDIVYAGAPATARDVAAARRAWPQVPEEARAAHPPATDR